MPWCARVLADLPARGFDLAHRFATAPVAHALALPALAAAPTAIVVGNTRALWPIFRAAYARDPALRASADPLDRYTEQALAGARAYFAHARYAGAYWPIQRIAALAGFGALAPTNLLIHPTYGPWFALRAIVLVDEPPPPPPSSPPPPPCACADTACRARFAAACATPDDWRAWLAVRDACPIGRAHRYDDAQLAYHYTKDRAWLA